MGLFVTLLFAAVLAGPDSFIPEPPPQAPQPPRPAAQAQPKPTPTDQVVNLSEMEELRAELKAMKEENAKLLRKIDDLVTALTQAQAGKPAADAARPGANAAAQGARAAAAAAVPHRNWSRIEIGMTREDVDRFIATHHNLKLIGVSADAGVVGGSVETVVRTQGTGGTTVVRRGGRPTPRTSDPARSTTPSR